MYKHKNAIYFGLTYLNQNTKVNINEIYLNLIHKLFSYIPKIKKNSTKTALKLAISVLKP